MTVRYFNLVLPLAHKATAMHIKDTADSHQAASCAVAPLIGNSLRQGNVDSKIQRSTPLIQIMPGIRTSTMATRTIGTRTIKSEPALSADYSARPPADFFIERQL